MKLTERMQGVANFVTPGLVVADIGTDHSYLPIYLIQQGVCPKAVAMDVNKGPLKIAQENIDEAGLSERITTRLSDGLTKLERNEAQSVIVAGMGGRLVLKILWDSRDKWKEIQEFILQPQSELVLFRRQMEEWGFVCKAEDMILEDGKYYPMGRYTWKEKGHLQPVGEDITEELSEAISPEKRCYYRYGERLIKDRNPVLQEYLSMEKGHLSQLLEALKESKDSDKKARRQEEILFKIKDNQYACQLMAGKE